jgi:hypothetical protein
MRILISVIMFVCSIYVLINYKKTSAWAGGGHIPPFYLAIIILVASIILLIDELKNIL